MIDISDGLASEINHICDQSKVGAIIYKPDIPIINSVREIAKRLNEDEYDYALSGGEDYELLFTVPKEVVNKVTGYKIGEITKEAGIWIVDGDKKEMLTKEGYNHFLSKFFN